MTKREKLAKAEEGAQNAKRYARMLRDDGGEPPEAAAFYKKHEKNSTFKIVADLGRGVMGALYAGKRVQIKIRTGGDRRKKPTLTRLPTRPLREPNKN